MFKDIEVGESKAPSRETAGLGQREPCSWAGASWRKACKRGWRRVRARTLQTGLLFRDRSQITEI